MSYDIKIRADETYSKSVPLESVRSFLSGVPNVQSNGSRHFLFQVGDRLWMEIDLESLSEEGDSLEEAATSDAINSVALHIPYAFLGDDPERDYFPLARAIARHIGWPATDLQKDKPL